MVSDEHLARLLMDEIWGSDWDDVSTDEQARYIRAAQVVVAAIRADADLAALRETARKLAVALSDLYPGLAGRVIQLEQTGEDRAAAAWNDDARRIHALLATPAVRALLAERKEAADDGA